MDGQRLRCPKCGSEDIHFATSHESKSFSGGNACCGFLLAGPIGILCGLCGAGSSTKSFWVCRHCGAEFQADDVKRAETAKQEAVTQARKAAEREEQERQARIALFDSVPATVLEHIREVIADKEDALAALKAEHQREKTQFFEENPKVKNLRSIEIILRISGVVLVFMLTLLLTNSGIGGLVAAGVSAIAAALIKPSYRQKLPKEWQARKETIAAKEEELEHLRSVSIAKTGTAAPAERIVVQKPVTADAIRFCDQCGTRAEAGESFCGHCGNRLH